METYEREQSEFNSGIDYLKRIGTWYKIISNAKLNKDITLWIDGINGLRDELITEMTEEEKTEFKKKIRDIEKLHNTYLFFDKQLNDKYLSQKKYNNLTNKIREVEHELRQLYKDAGLQHKIKEDWTNSDEQW